MLLTLLFARTVNHNGYKTECYSKGCICTYVRGQLVDKIEIPLLMARIDADEALTMEQKSEKRLYYIDIIKNHSCE